MKLAPVLVVLALAGVARAEPTPIDLTHAFDTSFAVSTQITSVDSEPTDLVDGNPATAWTSKSGDLVGAWLAVRVAPGASVTTLRLTVGFTHVDKQRGDLFTANARIKKVRVSRDGEQLYDKVLDPDSRTLQDLPVVGGGEFRIEVLDVVPGANPNWRETCVSELEVWGQPPTAFGPMRRTTPAVTVGAFERTHHGGDRDCYVVANALLHSSSRIVDSEAEPVDGDLRACNVELVRADDSTIHDHAVFLMRERRPVTRDVVKAATHHASGADGGVKVAAVDLGTARGLLVEVKNRTLADGDVAGTMTSTLYDATDLGLFELLHFDSTWSTGNTNTSELCTLELGNRRASRTDVDVHCTTTKDTLPDPKKVTTRVQHFRWNGSKYAPL